MTLPELLQKIAKGDAFTDDDKKFAAEYDAQKAIDTAAANARRDADKKTKDAEKRADDAEKALAALQSETSTKAGTYDATIKAMQADIGKLTKANEEAQKREAAATRSATIAARAKALGIEAVRGVDGELFSAMLERAVGDIDVATTAALDSALNAFKSANTALIAAPGAPGSGIKGGNPGNTGAPAVNPFSAKFRNLTEQINIQRTNPQLAESLKAQAAAETT